MSAVRLPPAPPRGIVVEPLAGLCNRMRTIDGAITLSALTAHPLHVVWTVRGDMGARFDELFEVPACFASLRQFRDPPWRRLPRVALDRLRYDRYLDNDGIRALSTIEYDFGALAEFRSVRIRGFHRVVPTTTPFVDFVPVAPIRDRIAAPPDLERCVGVHVRRTDHLHSIEASPTQRFVELMRAELDIEPDTRFFVATDDPSEEALLEREFPGRIVVHRKASLARDDASAIQDAVVDLYCLARCRSIIGSMHSSFSYTAALIGGRPLVAAA